LRIARRQARHGPTRHRDPGTQRRHLPAPTSVAHLVSVPDRAVRNSLESDLSGVSGVEIGFRKALGIAAAAQFSQRRWAPMYEGPTILPARSWTRSGRSSVYIPIRSKNYDRVYTDPAGAIQKGIAVLYLAEQRVWFG